MTAFWIGGLFLLAAAALYWLLISTEGTYLGPQIVALLYDWTAHRYENIKNVSFLNEVQYIGLPLAERLEGIQEPVILDVATGTARVARALLRGTNQRAHIIGLDRSPGMLKEAAHICEDLVSLDLVLGDAANLPIADGCCDCVVCLEALEFFASPDTVLREFLRVLKPGGQLLVSNRVGTDALAFPDRLAGRGDTERRLEKAGLSQIQTERWQIHYDIIWAAKP